MSSTNQTSIIGLSWRFLCSSAFVVGFSGATYAANAEVAIKPANQAKTAVANASSDLTSVLSDAERAAIEKEAALQDYRESKGAEDPKDLKKPEELRNDYSYREEGREERNHTSATNKSSSSTNTSRRRSFTTYKPGSQSPARDLKSTPGTRAFGK